MRRCRCLGQTQVGSLVLVVLPVLIVTLAAIPLAMILRKPKMLAMPVAVHAD